jgi:murein L,D-transpeptidase YcbB/YkuD
MRLSIFALSALLATGGMFPATASAQRGELRLDLNIPTQQIVLYEGEREIKRYRVSVGKRGHETPLGTYRIGSAEWNPSWTPPNSAWARDARPAAPGASNNPMGRVKLHFAPLYFIHGTNDVRNLGSPASHGCVRMHNDDVVELATILHERAQANVAASAIPAILRNRTVTRRASFERPVQLTIRYDPVVVVGDELRIYPDIYRRNRLHVEGVYQALIAAGYDASAVDRAAVQRLVQGARGSNQVVTRRLSETFAGLERTAAVADR